jgi:hypothetical protein
MNSLNKLLLACVPVIGLAACGGGDTADRLDLADPVVRFVHASPVAPNVTLYRADVSQSDATNVAYRFASNYFDVSTGDADWSVKTATGALTLGTVSIAPAERGTKYTVIALPSSATASTAYLIVDPYNKGLTSDSTHLRVMNASFNAANIDLYMNAIGTDISPSSVTPIIAATAFKTAGPASGSDSRDIPGGTYQLTITAAGSKTPLFRGLVSFGANKDVLLLTVPDALQAGGIGVLMKLEGTAGTTEIPAS